jgi:hypothetical protein
MKACIVLNFGSKKKTCSRTNVVFKGLSGNQLGGCKKGGWDYVSLNEVSMNIVSGISYPLDILRHLDK